MRYTIIKYLEQILGKLVISWQGCYENCKIIRVSLVRSTIFMHNKKFVHVCKPRKFQTAKNMVLYCKKMTWRTNVPVLMMKFRGMVSSTVIFYHLTLLRKLKKLITYYLNCFSVTIANKASRKLIWYILAKRGKAMSTHYSFAPAPLE